MEQCNSKRAWRTFDLGGCEFKVFGTFDVDILHYFFDCLSTTNQCLNFGRWKDKLFLNVYFPKPYSELFGDARLEDLVSLDLRYWYTIQNLSDFLKFINLLPTLTVIIWNLARIWTPFSVEENVHMSVKIGKRNLGLKIIIYFKIFYSSTLTVEI